MPRVAPALWLPAYVALGSNLEEPRTQVESAIGHLRHLPLTRLMACSKRYATAPLGPQDQPPYVNAAVGLLTRLGARELLSMLLDVEKSMGRRRNERWGPRIIDLDLLWMAGEPIAESGLTLPHPCVSERNFVLYPLSDIAPTLSIPGHGRVDALKSRVGGAGIAALV